MTSRADLLQCERIVVKLGTNVLTHDGSQLALGRLYGIVEDIAGLRAAGKQLLLVSSGAVGMGVRALGLTQRPAALGLRQACAAVGQGHLMSLYISAFSELGAIAGQVLLTHEDLAERERALCVHTTLTRLLELGVVPILNENDSASVRELVEDEQRSFGDNDGLSARVAVSVGADLLILLTDVAGVYERDPREHPGAEPLRELDAVDERVLAFAAGAGRSSGGTGGMASKLEAARLASEAGTQVVIAPGSAPNAVRRILEGEPLGTRVRAAARRGPRERRIAVGDAHRGALVVNAGALRAMTESKASLLPIGVVGVEGAFASGAVVEIRDASGRVHGRGLVNYDSDACRKLAGRHSSEIDAALGWRSCDALVTRTNLVLARV